MLVSWLCHCLISYETEVRYVVHDGDNDRFSGSCFAYWSQAEFPLALALKSICAFH